LYYKSFDFGSVKLYAKLFLIECFMLNKSILPCIVDCKGLRWKLVDIITVLVCVMHEHYIEVKFWKACAWLFLRFYFSHLQRTRNACAKAFSGTCKSDV